jgi:hypothetical protein
MAGPTSAQLGAVRMLIEQAPDSALRSLERALANVADGPMGDIRDMVRAEGKDRAMRNLVFAPVMPFFISKPGALPGPRFPLRVCAGLWAMLKTRRVELMRAAREAYDDRRQGDEREPPVFDSLLGDAAVLLRMEPQNFFRGDDGPALAEQLAEFLDLAAIGRAVLARMPDWLAKATEERVTALKLMFKDATEVAFDATPRLLELILAHLSEPQTILRLIAALTDRATDRYLASSELASFGERLMADAEARIAAIKIFDPQGGAKAAHAAAHDVGQVCAVLAQFEQDVELSREGPWGSRVAAARKALALSVEGRLRDVDGLVSQALPLQNVRIAGRMTRPAPKVSTAPDEAAVERARALVVFLDVSRAGGAAGGYGALRTSVSEKVQERLNVYADEVLHLINTGEAPDNDIAQDYLAIAAEFMTYAKDKDAAQIIRRRAAAAAERQTSQNVA